MSPTESRSSSNANRVRFFDKSSLVESIASQKWDLVKILCTQPFNKHVQYGLSFVVVHITEEEKPKFKTSLVPERFLIQKSTESEGPTNLFAGKFRLRDDSPFSESDTAMGLFNRWKTKKAIPEQSTAVSIREASKKPELMREALTPKLKKIAPSCSLKTSSEGNDEKIEEEKSKVLDRNRMDLVFGDEEDKPNDKFEREIQKDKERLDKELEEKRALNGSKRLSTSSLQSKAIKKVKCQVDDEENTVATSEDPKKNNSFYSDKKKVESTPGPSKTALDSSKINSPKPQKNVIHDSTTLEKSTENQHDNRKQIVYKPFNELLEGVTIAISGIQNPDRANLRTMALALGAKYKKDWDNTCTHLICAYKNTPKYNQVKTLGKIVKRHWLEKCHQLRKRVPWRRYALDDREAGKPESDDEILDESMRPATSSTERSPEEDRALSLYDKDEITHKNVISSGEDTEDELDRVRSKTDVGSQERKTTSRRKESSPNQSVVISSDEESYITVKDQLAVMTGKEGYSVTRKGLFAGKKIFLSTSLGTDDREKLSRLLREHKATISDKDSNSNVIVSTKNEMNVIKDYVTPQWVYESCIMNCSLPTELYLA